MSSSICPSFIFFILFVTFFLFSKNFIYHNDLSYLYYCLILITGTLFIYLVSASNCWIVFSGYRILVFASRMLSENSIILYLFFTICWLHVHQCFILHLYCPGFNILHSEIPYLCNLLYLNFEFHSDATHFQDLLSIPLHYFLKFRAAFSYTVAKYFNSFITFHHPFLFIIFFFSICCSSSYLISFLIILRFLWFSG